MHHRDAEAQKALDRADRREAILRLWPQAQHEAQRFQIRLPRQETAHRRHQKRAEACGILRDHRGIGACAEENLACDDAAVALLAHVSLGRHHDVIEDGGHRRGLQD